MREAEQDKVRERLERLRQRVALGEFGKRAQRSFEVEAEAVREQAAGLIGEAAGKILSQNHGQRYYESWRLASWENESCAGCAEETELGAVDCGPIRSCGEFPQHEGRAGTPDLASTAERVQAHVLLALTKAQAGEGGVAVEKQ